MQFVEINTSELEGTALDYAVGVCDNVNMLNVYGEPVRCFIPHYSESWLEAGLIIEREINNLFKHNLPGLKPVWCAVINVPGEYGTMLLQKDGPTPLIAAMRCYVASKLGDVVKIPQDLLA